MESESVSPISDEDGDDTVIERLPFTRIQIATGSNEVVTSPSRNPLVRQDASNPSSTPLLPNGVKTSRVFKPLVKSKGVRVPSSER